MPTTKTRPPSHDSSSTLARVSLRALVVVAVVVLVMVAWGIIDVLLLLFGGVIVATVLAVIAEPFERRFKWRHRPAVAAAIVLVLAVLGLGAWFAGDRLVEQVGDLRSVLPKAWAALAAWLEGTPLGKTVAPLWTDLTGGGLTWDKLAGVLKLGVGIVGSLLLALVLGAYLAFDPGRYRENLLSLVAPRLRPQIDAALLASGDALARWLKGQSLSMLVVGIATATGLALLDVPLALTLGILAGVLDFVPFFGPIVAGVLAVMVAFTKSPETAMYVALLFVAIQQLEGYVLMPVVQEWAVDVSPVLAIAGTAAFATLFGIAGAVIATPLLIVVMVLVRELYIDGWLEGRSDAKR